MKLNLWLRLCLTGFVASCFGMEEAPLCVLCHAPVVFGLSENDPFFAVASNSALDCTTHVGYFHAHCLASLLKENREYTRCPVCNAGLVANIQHLPALVQAHFPLVEVRGIDADLQTLYDAQACARNSRMRFGLRLFEALYEAPAGRSFRSPAAAGVAGAHPLARVRRAELPASDSAHKTNYTRPPFPK